MCQKLCCEGKKGLNLGRNVFLVCSIVCVFSNSSGPERSPLQTKGGTGKEMAPGRTALRLWLGTADYRTLFVKEGKCNT